MFITMITTMPLSPAPALLIGLGARIMLDQYTRSADASIKDYVLFGVWQGVGLHYASRVTALAIVIGFAISAKLLVEFNLIHDVTRTATTLLGIALGVICAECASQFINFPAQSHTPDRRRRKMISPGKSRAPLQDRPVQLKNRIGTDYNGTHQRTYRETMHAISDMTSVDSNSEMIGPSTSMSSLEREITKLRTRASLADSERRRCKEERKWALSQGNVARAAQMKSQVKHFTALMQSFHREADAKLLEGNRARPPTSEELQVPSSRTIYRTRRDTDGQDPPAPHRSVEIQARRPSKQITRDTIR